MMGRWPAAAYTGIQTVLARSRHGWAPPDVCSLDEHLCRVTGEMLGHLAQTTGAWPPAAEFQSLEDWAAALAARAEALTAYRADDGATHARAREALRWVADHLTDLWD